jgi:Zn-dependent M28 family amino/carboxypeptidase
MVKLVADSQASSDFKHPRNLDRTADYLAAELQASGGRVSEQVYGDPGVVGRNIIARFGPESGVRIVVGAHYDAFGPLPGADDNASGVAGLLALAELLGRHPPATPVEIVTYTLEEPPFFRRKDMGSARHATSLKTNGVAVRAMLSLEMIGYFSDEEYSQNFPVSGLKTMYPAKGNFITVVGDLGSMGLVRRIKTSMRAATVLPVESMNAPRSVPGVDYSDHHPYWDAGFPAVMITDTAGNRNLAYHTPEDTADRLDYHRMALVVQGVYAAVVELSR